MQEVVRAMKFKLSFLKLWVSNSLHLIFLSRLFFFIIAWNPARFSLLFLIWQQD